MQPSPTIRYTFMDSPVGPLLLAGTAEALTAIRFAQEGKAARPEPGWSPDALPFSEPLCQLAAYFAGALREFDLRLDPRGTAFQQEVWRALRLIPYGRTRSYGELAGAIGKPAAVRAVGAANGKNPLPIVIPCHRVIGADGSLTGFGGGLDVKRKLLEIEGVLLPRAVLWGQTPAGTG